MPLPPVFHRRPPFPWVARAALVGCAVFGFAILGVASSLAAQEAAVPPPYAPYAFLIGEWDVGPEGGKAAAVTRFRWGGTKTYIWFAGALLVKGEEQPAWEGLLVWNGVRKNLDMLLVLQPTSGSLVQEQGTVHVESDGTVVRTITVFYSQGSAIPPTWDKAAGPGGASAEFRHTFRQDGPDRIVSSVMRKSESGWVPSFPGSDRLVMVRRAPRDRQPGGDDTAERAPGERGTVPAAVEMAAA